LLLKNRKKNMEELNLLFSFAGNGAGGGSCGDGCGDGGGEFKNWKI